MLRLTRSVFQSVAQKSQPVCHCSAESGRRTRPRTQLLRSSATPVGFLEVCFSAKRSVIVVLAVGVALLASFGGSEQAAPITSPGPAGASVVPDVPLAPCTGVGSCSAVACHGSAAAASARLLSPPGRNGEITRGSPQSAYSYTVWVTQDKHARAFEVLWNDRSKQIIQKLNYSTDATDVRRYEQPHREPRCLACHSTEASRPAYGGLVSDGVGCESCHGPASAWLEEHTKVTWDLMGDGKYSQFGMKNTKDLVVRRSSAWAVTLGHPPRTACRPAI